MSKQRVEILVIGAGRHQQKIQAAIYQALDSEFSESAKWSFPSESAHVEINESSRDLSVRVLSVGIDNDQLEEHRPSGLKVEVDSAGFWRDMLKSGVVASTVGEISSFALDPLESAINNTASLIADEVDRVHQRAKSGLPGGRTVEIYGEHLARLLEIQLERVKE